jgi:hypothetical protein
MNEPMTLMLRTLTLLGGRTPVAQLFSALPEAPEWVHRTYLEDLELAGQVIVRDRIVFLARAPAIVGAVHCE